MTSEYFTEAQKLGLEARSRDLLWMGQNELSLLLKPKDADWKNNIGLRQSHKGGHMKQADAQTELHEAHFIVPIGNPALPKATENQLADPQTDHTVR